ncbi:hypothetical protein N657DRAFT_631728 [Parathielavia appendiculata]|uniref:Ubiquitin-like domain-containing protein n=1 Tax=Parathielavia appendiculata TaxID=2587402 RepID=A0AAN6U2S1_9PEZI|nr:hypothetical protein N657DRAFT_631728 [Parathielavia appendiculata]
MFSKPAENAGEVEIDAHDAAHDTPEIQREHATDPSKLALKEKEKEETLLDEEATEEDNLQLDSAEATKEQKKPPIKFKGAVGRKFSFPFHLCQTWPGMEELIKRAFLDIDIIGPHIQEGHYYLIGPHGESILPAVWEEVVQPGWAITMHMWPLDKAPLRRHHRQQVDPGGIEEVSTHKALSEMANSLREIQGILGALAEHSGTRLPRKTINPTLSKPKEDAYDMQQTVDYIVNTLPRATLCSARRSILETHRSCHGC